MKLSGYVINYLQFTKKCLKYFECLKSGVKSEEWRVENQKSEIVNLRSKVPGVLRVPKVPRVGS
ncbi:MAG: hypothetical protein DRJ09_00840 [Bacteroidetes bacterium]|nr:MAG: hypothetical protein DRJ09_00840 [Bacteroidota bacterium]